MQNNLKKISQLLVVLLVFACMPNVIGEGGDEEVPEGGKVINVGFRYHFEPGVGDPGMGFDPVKGTFEPSSLQVGPVSVPLPIAKFIDMVPGPAKDVMSKLQTLDPPTVFLFKMLAVYNSSKKLEEGEGRVGFIMTNTMLLLSRLSRTKMPSKDGSEGKSFQGPSFFIDKLPGPVKEIFSSIKIPGLVTKLALQRYKDRKGQKGPSDTRKAIGLMRETLGFDARTDVAFDELLPLLEEKEDAAKLNITALYRMLQAVEDHTWSMNKGYPKDWTDDDKALETEVRAEAWAEFIDILIGNVEYAVDEGLITDPEAKKYANEHMLKRLKELLNLFAEKDEDDQDIFFVPKETIKITYDRPIFGEGEWSEKVDVPLPEALDIMYNEVVTKVVARKFAVDEGYIWNDSNMSKAGMGQLVLSIVVRMMIERNNEEFNEEGGGLIGFAKSEFSKVYMRAPQHFAKLEEIIRPIADKVKAIIGDMKKMQADAMEQGQQLQEEAIAKNLDTDADEAYDDEDDDE